MERRNINIMVGIALLTGILIWISTANLTYIYPDTSTSAPTSTLTGQETAPLWASLLFWQGDQERSIRVHQGLDLQGGVQVVLEAVLSDGQELPEGAMQAARIVVANRVNGLGVTEPLVQLQGNKRMIVELPGISNPDMAIRTLRETGLLEFVDAGRLRPPSAGTVITTSLGGPSSILTDTAVETDTTSVITTTTSITSPTPAIIGSGTVYETIITGSDLDSVENAGFNPNTRGVEINFSLKSEGGQVFGEYSGANIGNYLCIILDKVVISCPTINARIDSNGTISLGSSNLQEGQALSIQLRYGALPVPLKVVENRSVGPTLGQDSVQRSIRAGAVGLVVVLLFMITYYRLPGLMAALSMIIYGLLNFALYKTIPVTLTLPAITGFILSLGMAVDANILVFERMKEELRIGRSLKRATELGFQRSWPSIRDSAISTLITSAILFWFGTNFGASVVKGFAITLALGVVTNIFTAVTITRAFLRFMLGFASKELKDNKLLMGFSLDDGDSIVPEWVSSSFDIVSKRKWYFSFSAIFITIGLIGMAISTFQFGSPLKLSIDFTSGSLMELQFEQPEQVQPGDVRKIFTDFTFVDKNSEKVTDFKDTTVTTAEQVGQKTILIRSKFLPEEAKIAIQDKIRADVGAFEELRFDAVGPAIGKEVTKAGGYAVIAAAIAILLFLLFAFRSVPNASRYGIAAVMAMGHDILVTAGLFAIAGLFFGWEIDALFLTAILTVIGYSVHDTIIVFDRLRENLPKRRTESYEVVCNRSLLETITRSLVTSLSTMFVVVAILAFGGATIKQFVAIIMVGIISGTYSSIFNAVPVLVSWKQGDFRRDKAA